MTDKLEKEFRCAIGIEFVLIEPGKFVMGSNSGKDSEKPAHTIEITKPFYISKYPVTNQQFGGFSVQRQTMVLGIMNRSSTADDQQKPKTSVSWDTAFAFCQYVARREKRAGVEDDGKMFRLPTEAEWEYVCRAGTTTDFWFGNECTSKNANVMGGPGQLMNVKHYPLNPWGIGDLHGNSAEWVQDYFSPTYYAESPAKDPTGPATGKLRAVRAGSYSDLSEDCRSVSRIGLEPEKEYSYVGFRVVKTV